MVKKEYIKPEIVILKSQSNSVPQGSRPPKYNDVGNFGFGDEEDDDRTGDDNWDNHWGWDD